MQRTTVAELRAVFVDYVNAVESLGVDVSFYKMQEGSEPMGVFYRVENRGVDAVGIPSYGIIGAKRGEAVTTLRNITNAIRSTRDIVRGV